MKLATLPILLSCAAAISAAPLSIVVISKGEEVRPPNWHPFRVGHAAVHNKIDHGPVAAHSHKPTDGLVHILPFPVLEGEGPAVELAAHGHGHRRPCGKGKGVAMSNWFRQALGFPLIDAPHGVPAGPHAAVAWPAAPAHPNMMARPAHPHGDHGPHHHHAHIHAHHHHRHGHHSFAHRLQFALMSLGPWEGRLVAFVLGCGIGVLLRLVWVMGVLAVRSCRGPPEVEHEIVFIEEETYLLPPPEYTDEKVALAQAEAQED